MISQLLEHLSGQEEELLSLQRTLVSIPALGPDNGGDGELEKSRFLTSYLEKLGCDELRTIEAPDSRVSCGYRPTVVGRIFGTDRSKTLWIIAHTDIVPTGDLALWDTDPFELHREGDLIMGRGVEDNHQGLVSSLLLAKGIRDLNVTPPMNLGLILVADEETGSKYGLDYVMAEHSDLFAEKDLFLIPDCGVPESDKIEVAEKSSLWLKITVNGRQRHASTPDQGVNSLIGAAAFILALVLIFLVLSAQFESFKDPLIVMMTVPLALTGALIFMWYFDITMNIFSQIGIIMLVGLVSKNGILIVEFANQRKLAGMSKFDAIRYSAAARFRPILMTSLSTILGVMPLALGLGEGAQSRVAMGVAVVGGLTLSTFLTLYVVPAIYLFISSDSKNIVHEPDHRAETANKK